MAKRESKAVMELREQLKRSEQSADVIRAACLTAINQRDVAQVEAYEWRQRFDRLLELRTPEWKVRR